MRAWRGRVATAHGPRVHSREAGTDTVQRSFRSQYDVFVNGERFVN